MKKIVLIILAIGILAYGSDVFASGECGFSCCLAGATGSGITLAENIGLSLQYEFTYMENIKTGSTTVSPNSVITQHHGMYAIPTQMEMQMFLSQIPLI
ncbi:MAG: hypothetical protein HQK93_05895 [Nitrospirae bacterium]|nr:hypothetical protein [Nitrospirota bacterium]